MKKSIKNFNPDRVAELELKMWQAYYQHNFLNLFLLLISLTHECFGVNYLVSINIAYHAAFAAADFRMHKGKENKDRILKNIIKFYKIVTDHSIEQFDYKKAGELELNWWFVDRYPERYQISRTEALALAMAVVYNTEVSKLNEYAAKRAEAMVIHDEVQNLKDGKGNWNEAGKKIGHLLNMSYNSLYKAIN